jgi:predicted ArsR family transcriptional regulator
MTDLQKQARALGNPTRHQIFRLVAQASGPVGVAELTERFGFNHNAIRQQLAKLVDAGLVSERKAVRTGRGRPQLRYAVDPNADSRWGVTGSYERLSLLLAEMIRTRSTALDVGRREGKRLREAAGTDRNAITVEAVRAREGFDPATSRVGRQVAVVLRKCPFESTAVSDPDVVRAVHRGIAEGLVAGSETTAVEDLVANDPRRAGCRLILHDDPS